MHQLTRNTVQDIEIHATYSHHTKRKVKHTSTDLIISKCSIYQNNALLTINIVVIC